MIFSVSNQKYDAYSFNQLHLGQQLEIADAIAGLWVQHLNLCIHSGFATEKQ